MSSRALALLMLAIALVVCVLGAEAPSAPDVAAVVAVLERSPSAEGRARLATELAGLGPSFLPDLFSVLAFGAGLERELGAEEEGALTEAMASFGSAPLRAFFARRLTAAVEPEERLGALRILARVGSSEDLSLVRLAVQGAVPGLDGKLQEACAGILRRDPRALEALRRWMLEAPIETAAAIARGIGASACQGSISALASTLGYRVDLDVELLTVLAPLAASAPKPLEEEILAAIEDRLEENEERVLRAAVMTIGHAQHAGAMPRLIALLEHESRGVSTAAEWALEHITGLRFHADAERWRAWLLAERTWLDQNGQRLRAELHDPQAEVVIRALGELSSHRLPRHELALETLAGLAHGDPLVRRLTCLVLARLGSSAAAPGLLHALEDEDESVARAARQALEVLGLAPAGPAHLFEAAILRDASRNPMSRPRNRLKDA